MIGDLITSLGVSGFGIIVGVGVALIMLAIWIFNRRQPESSRKVNMPTEVLVAVVTIFGLIIILIIRSRIFANDPLLLLISVILLITAIASFVDAYFTFQVRKDIRVVSARFGAQMAGLGNLQFYPTKDETFKELTRQTYQASEKLIATRFSPADISIEDEYWNAIRQKAFDQKVLYVRIHSLAHTSSSSIDGVCKLISELRGARNFRLAIAFFSNSFEIIISDEKECVFCFHDLQMTIRNGFKVDSMTQSGARIVSNFDSTLRRMLETCYLTIDFDRYVKTTEDVERLQQHLRQVHKEYLQGKLPRSIHLADMEDFLASQVFVQATR